jgi:hypothetical protein
MIKLVWFGLLSIWLPCRRLPEITTIAAGAAPSLPGRNIFKKQ